MPVITVEEALVARRGKVLVTTNGVFDILHAGHVSYLEAACQLGELLIVGLNSDRSTRLLGKGPNRPLNPQEDRALVVAALRWVDAVVIFDEPTPEAMIQSLRPEVHVKGGDYQPNDLPETRIVESYGGRVVILPFMEGRSTTSTLHQLGIE